VQQAGGKEGVGAEKEEKNKRQKETYLTV